jgi:hypothetical protein
MHGWLDHLATGPEISPAPFFVSRTWQKNRKRLAAYTSRPQDLAFTGAGSAQVLS